MDMQKYQLLQAEKDKYIQSSQLMSTYVTKLENIEDRYKQCAYFIGNAEKIAVVTGAGISTDSGIPDFRSNNGIYSYNPEKLFDINYYKKKPQDLQKVLIELFNGRVFKPNNGHTLLKKLEEDKDVTIITQNIDNLHEKAMSSNVLHVHGTLDSATCFQCKSKKVLNWENNSISLQSLSCDCGAYYRPDIVFYNENIKYFNEAINAVKDCDLLIVLGTSLSVYPVANLPSYTLADTPIIIINNTETSLDNDRMSVVFHNNIAITLENIMSYLY